jgi:hypothetical protein
MICYGVLPFHGYLTKDKKNTCVFLKWELKLFPNLLIKKKRIAQFINRKPGENHHNRNTSRPSPETSNTLAPRQTTQLTQPLNLQQPTENT